MFQTRIVESADPEMISLFFMNFKVKTESSWPVRVPIMDLEIIFHKIMLLSLDPDARNWLFCGAAIQKTV